jgi:ribose/xylose/arabinose/galactoside ABC-type transport system permease subunit
MTTTSHWLPGTPSGPPAATPRRRWTAFLSQELVLLISIIALMLTVGAINARYLAPNNVNNILNGNAYIAVAAIGMTMVIISGNIDISIGALIGVLAVISGNVAVSGLPPELAIPLAWLAPLVFGALAGAVTGFLVAYMRIPAIVVSLGMMSILQGGLISVTNGAWISDLPDGYALAQMRPLGIPMAVYFMVVLTLAAAWFLRYTPLGRSIYAVGGNREAARLSGIDEQRVTFMVFVLNGVFVGIAALLYATQLSIIQSTAPAGVELLVITAAVVGGVSILGGVGTPIGATLAAVLLSAIGTSLVFISVSPYWIRAVQGVLILATVLADLLRRRRQMRR